MNKTLKKTLSIILAILMIAATMPVAFARAVAESGSCGDNVTYTYNSETGELVISGTGAIADYIWSGSPFYESAIKTVVIEDGVTSIGDYVFHRCQSLESVTIPDSVTNIGMGAFYDCTSLKNVTIPDGVTSIGDYAFAYCSGLESVTIPYSVTSIGDSAFYSCTSLASVTIPDSVTSIGDHAFSHCKSLESVTIPDSVTSIGDHAFFMCTSVESVIFGNSVTSIGESAIDCGTSLKSVTISSGEPSMYEDMLDAHVSSIELLVVPCSWTTPLYDPCKTIIIHYANEDFYGACGDSCESLGLPHSKNSETGICEFCVSDSGFCKGGASWTLYRDGTLTISGEGSIDQNAFLGNEDVKRVIIGDKITSIGNNAFYNCTGIINITLGEGLTSIGNNAFYNCTSLASVKIPNNLTNIGKHAFDNCSDLTVVSVPCTQNGENPLYNFDSSVNVTVRDHIYKYGECTLCGDLCSHSIENDTCTICGIITGICGNDVTYTYNSKTGELVISGTGAIWNSMVNLPFYSAIKTVVIEDGVTSIDDYAFYNCTSLESVTIGNSVTRIGNDAFYFCTSLKSVTIGNSVTIIGSDAFGECTSLESVTIPDSVTSISECLFEGCISLKNVTIPDSVTSIGRAAFYWCLGLESVTIGNSVTRIGDQAFFECTSLESVIFGNSVKSIGSEAFYDCTSLKSVTISGGRASIYKNVDMSNIELLVVPCSWLTTEFSLNIGSANIVYIHDANEDFYGACGDSCESLGLPHSKNSETGICEFCVSDSGSCKGGASWTLYRDGTLTISGEGSIDQNAFLGNEDIKRVIIGDKIKSIGDNAFYDCTSLRTVTVLCLWDSENPLYNFDSSVKVTVRDHIYKDGECTICGYPCSHSFENDTCTICGIITGTCGDNLTWTLYSDGTLTISGEGAIDDLAFTGRTGIKNVIIGDGVTSIGDSAFFYCTSLESVTIPDSVTTIGLGAFELCSSLANITIPDSVTIIDNDTFYGCTSLESITIPDSITRIGDNAFYNCTSLRTVTVPCSWDSENPLYSFDSSVNVVRDHSFTNYIGSEAVQCEENAKETASCDNNCGETDTREVENSSLEHIDSDDNYECDYGCGYEFEKSADPTDTDCDHICHSDNGIVSFLWKIVNFLQKLFGIQQYCDCGIAH